MLEKARGPLNILSNVGRGPEMSARGVRKGICFNLPKPQGSLPGTAPPWVLGREEDGDADGGGHRGEVGGVEG